MLHDVDKIFITMIIHTDTLDVKFELFVELIIYVDYQYQGKIILW